MFISGHKDVEKTKVGVFFLFKRDDNNSVHSHLLFCRDMQKEYNALSSRRPSSCEKRSNLVACISYGGIFLFR